MRDVEDLGEVEYLFWVGCAGAFDDRAKKTTRAVAELLHTAGVSFAVLGQAETCTGDPARRAGNEFVYQMLAQQNVETLREAGATKAVVTCAHCFNTIRNEYRQLGLELEVVHHTQLLNRLVRDGRLTPVAPTAGEGDGDGEAGGSGGDGTRVAVPLRLFRSRTTTPAISAGTTRSTSRRASSSAPCPGSRSARCRGTVPIVLLRSGRRADVDGGVHRHPGQPRTHHRGGRHRRRTDRDRLPVLHA